MIAVYALLASVSWPLDCGVARIAKREMGRTAYSSHRTVAEWITGLSWVVWSDLGLLVSYYLTSPGQPPFSQSNLLVSFAHLASESFVLSCRLWPSTLSELRRLRTCDCVARDLCGAGAEVALTPEGLTSATERAAPDGQRH